MQFAAEQTCTKGNKKHLYKQQPELFGPQWFRCQSFKLFYYAWIDNSSRSRDIIRISLKEHSLARSMSHDGVPKRWEPFKTKSNKWSTNCRTVRAATCLKLHQLKIELSVLISTQLKVARLFFIRKAWFDWLPHCSNKLGGIHLLVVMKDIKATSLILGTEVGQKEIKLLVKTTSGFIKNSQRHRSSTVLYEALFSVNSTPEWVNFILLNPSSMLEMKTVMTSAKLRRQRERAKEGERKKVGILYKGLTLTATTKYHKANGASTKKNLKVHRHL